MSRSKQRTPPRVCRKCQTPRVHYVITHRKRSWDLRFTYVCVICHTRHSITVDTRD